jgi:hypothetical protein
MAKLQTIEMINISKELIIFSVAHYIVPKTPYDRNLQVFLYYSTQQLKLLKENTLFKKLEDKLVFEKLFIFKKH